jgi:hypothetical protein
LIFGAFTLILLITLMGEARGAPAFARKYRFSCSTCHAPFPRLKEYGEEFAGRGFKLPPEEEPARATYDTGDPLLMLPRDLPLAVRIDSYAEWEEGERAENTFSIPYVFKILSGGPLTPNFSYYFYFIIEEGEVEGLEDAYVQFSSIFGLPVDVMLGQFQVSDPLFKREMRLEKQDYEIYTVRVGKSRVNLTYDRGVMAIVGLPEDVEAVLQVVNGNGISDPDAHFDRDSHKHFGLKLSRGFGPLGLGVFGYAGKEESAGGSHDNVSFYVGPDVGFELNEKWHFGAQYLYREDDNPFFDRGGDDVVTQGGFAELQYFPQGQDGRWVFSALYNIVDSDDASAKREIASVTGNYLIARNVRFLVELGRNIEEERNKGTVGIIAAF